MTQDDGRRYGREVAEQNVPPPGIPWMACYFDGRAAKFQRFGTRNADWTAPMKLGDLVRCYVRPGSATTPMAAVNGKPFVWRTMDGDGPHAIGRALAADLDATYCETEDAFDALVRGMMAADPHRAYRPIV